jgi:hypothetical protein
VTRERIVLSRQDLHIHLIRYEEEEVVYMQTTLEFMKTHGVIWEKDCPYTGAWEKPEI